eukprot:882878-Pleurochrysis_carterae.AAC.1
MENVAAQFRLNAAAGIGASGNEFGQSRSRASEEITGKKRKRRGNKRENLEEKRHEQGGWQEERERN